MAEPLKNMYNEPFLRQFGGIIQAAYSRFSIDDFVENVLVEEWEGLALKQRIRKISLSLGTCLPGKYAEAINILLVVNESCSGFPYLILPDFVEVYGQEVEDWELSVLALEKFTSHSSAEFAVRPFIIRDPEKMMKQMLQWSNSLDEHVRRLASEGCRPRLPWGQALVMFKKDPTPVLEILEQLKSDPSLYVRKSVANNLNDIAKDHPQLVIGIARRWFGQNRDTDWIVRHACRTLIRKADPEVLALFGYAESSDDCAIIENAELAIDQATLSIGGECVLEYKLLVREGDPVRIRIEYGIDFVKSSGKVSRKKFLLSDKTVVGGTQLQANRTHRWSDLTTRRHYPGKHRIVLLVNGLEVAATEILLEMHTIPLTTA
ncbi:DNA alkylation repair protein [Paenibacillus endoradicis]|uniref:DNA alkylation repair protein n=1 Tax=Paenibacillus endoradicis TaxID=2972487 RepID=UPI002159508C|nr:DNA alkylation repair protein [Paenibacillus endoradicis]MCR8657667.1 DNA alkylation repair protein [Paenibacillus endoradicis]